MCVLESRVYGSSSLLTAFALPLAFCTCVHFQDFKWLKAHQSPHWSKLPEGERIQETITEEEQADGISDETPSSESQEKKDEDGEEDEI